MPQSLYRLRNDLKCVEWDVKPYYTILDKNIIVYARKVTYNDEVL